MYYDRKEIDSYIARLLQVYGQYRQLGFYTVKCCSRKNLEIVDAFGKQPLTMKYNGQIVNLDRIEVGSELGEAIIKFFTWSY